MPRPKPFLKGQSTQKQRTSSVDSSTDTDTGMDIEPDGPDDTYPCYRHFYNLAECNKKQGNDDSECKKEEETFNKCLKS
jgi:hypothetical protein